MFEILEFYAGKEIDFDSLAKALTSFGYMRHEKVGGLGDFAIRGGVVDIFPFNFSLPVRLELVHDTVDSIHTFDPATGTRLEPHRMVILFCEPSANAGGNFSKTLGDAPAHDCRKCGARDFTFGHRVRGICT